LILRRIETMDFRHFRFVMVILIVVLTIGVGFVTAAGMGRGAVQEVRLDPDPSDTDTEYGRSVAIDGNLVAVGMGGDGAIGSVYVYRHMGPTYVLDEKLAFPEEVSCDCLDAKETEDPEDEFTLCPEFGRTVAIQGDTIFVGARFAPVGEISAGAVYVFKNKGDSWVYTAKIVSPNPEAEDNFGRALAVQGNLLVVTARKEDQTSTDVGGAYVYQYTGREWMYYTKLTASDATSSAYFGQSVAIQGEYLVIGARNADPQGAGGFYLFRRDGAEWVETAKVSPPNGKNNDQYGFCIAMSGNTVVVGARRTDQNSIMKDTGSAFVYTIKDGFPVLVTKLTASDAEASDEFGQSVAFVDDLIAVSAWKDDGKKGSIYLFRMTDGTWTEIGKIQASDGKSGDEFGYSLAALGNRLVTGAHKADFMYKDAGAAYVIPVRL